MHVRKDTVVADWFAGESERLEYLLGMYNNMTRKTDAA